MNINTVEVQSLFHTLVVPLVGVNMSPFAFFVRVLLVPFKLSGILPGLPPSPYGPEVHIQFCTIGYGD